MILITVWCQLSCKQAKINTNDVKLITGKSTVSGECKRGEVEYIQPTEFTKRKSRANYSRHCCLICLRHVLNDGICRFKNSSK